MLLVYDTDKAGEWLKVKAREKGCEQSNDGNHYQVLGQLNEYYENDLYNQNKVDGGGGGDGGGDALRVLESGKKGYGVENSMVQEMELERGWEQCHEVNLSSNWID